MLAWFKKVDLLAQISIWALLAGPNPGKKLVSWKLKQSKAHRYANLCS